MKHSFPLVLTILIGVATMSAQRSGEVESLLSKGLNAALHHDYPEAILNFESASRVDTSDPAGVVLLAGVLHQMAEDLSAPFNRRAFDSLLTLAEVLATSDNGRGNADRALWRSTAHGMLSVVESQSGHWMSAIRDALASASEARTSLRLDPNLADAGLPLGNYLYWRTRKTEALQWLPFIPDDRIEGIQLLEVCAQEGRYHQWASVSSLIWILHDAGELDRAETWARRGLASFPENRIYLAGLAKVLESRGKSQEAAQAWGSVSSSLRREPLAGRYAIFSASVNQLRCAGAGGDRSTVLRLMREIEPPAKGDVPDWIAPRLAAKTKEWLALREALSFGSTEATTPNRTR